MFKTILAATDQVSERDPVVETAAHLAAANRGQLFLLHVLESASTRNRRRVKHYATGQELHCDEDYEDQIRQQLQVAHQAAIDVAPVTQVRVGTGYPWEAILRWARRDAADLIVMGPHSGRAFQKGVVRVVGQVGSTVEGVIRREKCPVMIVNPHLPDPNVRFKRILVGIDFSEACECALCFAGRLAKFHGAKVFAFHMLPIPPYPKYSRRDYEADRSRARERLMYFCREYLEETDWSGHIKGGAQPHRELVDLAAMKSVDLIVLGSHTRHSQGKWYPGSAVERVSYRANCPVMVINDPEALQPWVEMQTSLARETQSKDRLIQVFTRRAALERSKPTDL
ncbi:MAG: universal stress protein [Desulfobacterales bacterium]|nr:universal stress protein [Desulfobacterales bacterium]